MSDVDQNPFATPNPDERTNVPVQEAVPHAGKQNWELPVREFDKTTLQEAVDQERITVPESPAPLVEPTPEPAPQKTNRGAKIFGAIAAVAAIGGGAFALGSKSGGNETETAKRPAATAAPAVETPVTAVDAPVVIPATEAPAAVPEPTTPTEVPSSSKSAEVKNEEFTPIFMTADNPEALAEQFVHNMNCMLNSPSEYTQEMCLNVILGSVGPEEGPLTQGWKDAIVQIEEYRDLYPDYRQEISYELLDSTYNDTQASLVIHTTLTNRGGNLDYEGQTAEDTARFNFIREEAFTDGKMQPVWTVTSKYKLTPQEAAALGQ